MMVENPRLLCVGEASLSCSGLSSCPEATQPASCPDAREGRLHRAFFSHPCFQNTLWFGDSGSLVSRQSRGSKTPKVTPPDSKEKRFRSGSSGGGLGASSIAVSEFGVGGLSAAGSNWGSRAQVPM